MTKNTQRRFSSNNALGRALLATVVLMGLIAGFASVGHANLFGNKEPLAPELAFVPEIANVTRDSIEIEYTIADGYYLYRDKLAFTVSDVVTAGNSGISSLDTLLSEPATAEPVTFGPPVFAETTIIDDDFFGEQAVFRNSTTISLPYTSRPEAQSLTLAIKYQGCADIGLCYPPNVFELDVQLPQPELNARPASLQDTVNLQDTVQGTLQNTLQDALQQPYVPAESSRYDGNYSDLAETLGGGGSAEELLPPELAYLPQILDATPSGMDVSWFIEDGYYLYRDKISFSLKHAQDVETGAALISEGEVQHDEFFGNVSVLRHSAIARVSLDGALAEQVQQLAGTQGELIIYYQGCADIGVCFPPTQTVLPVSFSAGQLATLDSGLVPLMGLLDGNGGGGDSQGGTKAGIQSGGAIAVSSAGANNAGDVVNTNAASVAQEQAASAPPAQSEQDRLSSLLGASSLWLTVATFFGLGLLLAFTPCVLPMIPILSSLIVGQGQSMSTGRAFKLSLVYVLVMASTYALVGVAVGISGYNIQIFLQDPVVLSGIAVLFVALSLSMFGFYELQMPTSIQNKLTQLSNRQGGGQVGGVALMGFISTLIVGPCVTAPLAGALIYIAKTGDAAMGGAALFALGLGMGAPLLLIGTSAGKLVPKAGAWMNTTKHIFGILMLGMAIYMISRFLPTTVTMALYGILALMSGVYLGAADSISRQSSGWHRFGKGAGLAVSIYGVALLVGALAGGSSYTAPLRSLAGAGGGSGGTSELVAQTEHALPFQRVKSIENLQSVVAQASAEGRPVMLDFYADWCISCKEMEAFTFTDERVQELLSNAVVIQADVTANDAEDQALLKRFDLFGPPGIIFYDVEGRELPAARVVGFMNSDKFSDHIRRFIYPTDT